MVSVFASPVAPSKGGQFLCEGLCIASPPQRGGKREDFIMTNIQYLLCIIK